MCIGASHLNPICMYVYTCSCICIYIYKLVHNDCSIKSLLESREMKFDVCAYVCLRCMYVCIHMYVCMYVYICIFMYTLTCILYRLHIFCINILKRNSAVVFTTWEPSYFHDKCWHNNRCFYYLRTFLLSQQNAVAIITVVLTTSNRHNKML